MSFSGHNRGASTILYFMTAFINLFSFYRYEWKDEIVGSWLIKFIAQDNCQVRSHIYTLTYISCSAQSIRTIDRRSCHVSLGHINQVGLKGKHTVGLVTCLAKFPHGYGWNYKVQWRIQNVALMGGMRSRSLSVTRCLLNWENREVTLYFICFEDMIIVFVQIWAAVQKSHGARSRLADQRRTMSAR